MSVYVTQPVLFSTVYCYYDRITSAKPLEFLLKIIHLNQCFYRKGECAMNILDVMKIPAFENANLIAGKAGGIGRAHV